MIKTNGNTKHSIIIIFPLTHPHSSHFYQPLQLTQTVTINADNIYSPRHQRRQPPSNSLPHRKQNAPGRGGCCWPPGKRSSGPPKAARRLADDCWLHLRRWTCRKVLFLPRCSKHPRNLYAAQDMDDSTRLDRWDDRSQTPTTSWRDLSRCDLKATTGCCYHLFTKFGQVIQNCASYSSVGW